MEGFGGYGWVGEVREGAREGGRGFAIGAWVRVLERDQQ